MSQTVEVIIPADQLDELKAEIRAQLPTALFGTKDMGNGTVGVSVTLYSETPEILQRVVSALGSDRLELKSEPFSAPSLSAFRRQSWPQENLSLRPTQSQAFKTRSAQACRAAGRRVRAGCDQRHRWYFLAMSFRVALGEAAAVACS